MKIGDAVIVDDVHPMGMSGTLVSALILVLNTGPADRYEDPQYDIQRCFRGSQLQTSVHLGETCRLAAARLAAMG